MDWGKDWERTARAAVVRVFYEVVPAGADHRVYVPEMIDRLAELLETPREVIEASFADALQRVDLRLAKPAGRA